MVNKFKQTIQQAGEVFKEQAAAIGDAAKQKGYSIINDWIANIPRLEESGLKTTFFSLSVSISPVLDVELAGEAEAFQVDRLNELIEASKKSTPLNLVYTSIKTTCQLHQKAQLETINPLTVRIRVCLSPEIRVSYGEPICE